MILSSHKLTFAKCLVVLPLLYSTLHAQITPQVSAGVVHNLLLQTDGTLWSWGGGSCYQLGTSSRSQQEKTPTQVGYSSHWKSISAGGYHSIALKEDGTLWNWGCISTYDSNGVKEIPTQVGNDKDWVKIDAGYNYSMAIKSDGTLWTWGRLIWNQVGTSIDDTFSTPLQVGTDQDWKNVSAGWDETIALKEDGTLWMWKKGYRSEPYQMGKNYRWKSMVVESNFSYAIREDGTLWMWPANQAEYNPDPILANTTWKKLSQGLNNEYVLAIKSDNTLWNIKGTPRPVDSNRNFIAVATGQKHIITFKENGKWKIIYYGTK